MSKLEIVLGRIHAEGTKVNWNEGVLDTFKAKLAAGGGNFQIEIQRSMEVEARSVEVRFKNTTIASSTYDEVKKMSGATTLAEKVVAATMTKKSLAKKPSSREEE